MRRKLSCLILSFFCVSFIFNTQCSSAEDVSMTQKDKFNEQNIMADLWFQTSGEAKALYYQGYNIGTEKMNQALKKKYKKKPAVVLDIDETIVNNSPLDAKFSKVGQGSLNEKEWRKWIAKAKAKPLPGALDFLKEADRRGVDIYYISDRSDKTLERTMLNLKNIGAPQVTKNHVLLKRDGEKNKNRRRKLVAKTHRILLYFGDNLSDFEGFEYPTIKKRANKVDKMRLDFGNKLIVFPNPMYGNWEKALYNGKNNLSNEEKIKIRKSLLQGDD
ncbi:5'-nucleotidase, lipoprotein e(P4) family [Terrilactibacillus sp. BCM23-1]|uniref:5'-nucleotidase, lipoprotein e(P4) family n=1 Tax=Terrilactibacillus tamarindi TaxID=2599694 RepID=A0A6N8CQH9_9BACI|nr:5'-nucleotidase, lipoprotein e(P4) family [Terrilactibacillus tamarindi]MTT31918.1 5'-nucleotidase, lipoprotein e(P4) family [Terrilactibacillus tamarindi]